MLNKILSWLHRRGSSYDIMRHYPQGSVLYMRRHFIIRTRWFGVYLHQFFLDDEGDLHDHPWNWGSLLLRGYLKEEQPDGSKDPRSPMSFCWRQAERFHKLYLESSPGVPVTLFFQGRRRRLWGFLSRDGWVEAEKYGRTVLGTKINTARTMKFKGWLLPIYLGNEE